MADKRVGLRNYLQVLLLVVLSNVSLEQKVLADSLQREQKEILIAVSEIPYSLSPYALNTANALADQYSHLFFDPLMRWGINRELEYRLLDKSHRLKNGKIRFYLKKNIFFHSGNQMTTKDVVWSFKEAMSNKYLQRKLQYKIKLTAINTYQFDIETQLTENQLYDYLTHLFVLDSDYYEKHKIDYNFVQSSISQPIKVLPLSGTGPYRVAAFSPALNLRVQASLNYWQDEPTFSKLNFLKIKSPESRLYALLADDVDVSESTAHKNINSVHFLEGKDIYQVESVNALFLIVNDVTNERLKPQTARNAIHLAINQTGILKHILNGMGRVDNTYKLNAPAVLPPAYDATRAQYLLKKIEAPKELSLLVMPDKSAHTDEVLFTLKNMLHKVGIELKVSKAVNLKQWNAINADYDLLLSMWRSGLIEESNVYQDIFTNSYLSGHISALFSQHSSALTLDEKIQLFEEYQLSDKIIPLFSKNKIWAADNKYDLKEVFSVNAIPYWHRLTLN